MVPGLCMFGVAFLCEAPLIGVMTALETLLTDDAYYMYYWLIDAALSQFLGIGFVFAYVLAYCGYLRERTRHDKTERRPRHEKTERGPEAVPGTIGALRKNPWRTSEPSPGDASL